MVVLKRLADAERDGDRVYAVIRGVGSSSDGRGVEPDDAAGRRPGARPRAGRGADAGLDPATVGLVEAHGTATPAGDEAELSTLAEVFGPAGRRRAPAVLGSVKSMIGHTMPAAGAAGLVKAALALHHGMLLAHAALRRPPPGPRRHPVPGRAPRRAVGGRPPTPVAPASTPSASAASTRHVVLEEAPARPAGPPPSPSRLTATPTNQGRSRAPGRPRSVPAS